MWKKTMPPLLLKGYAAVPGWLFVKHPSLGFGSSHVLIVQEFEP